MFAALAKLAHTGDPKHCVIVLHCVARDRQKQPTHSSKSDLSGSNTHQTIPSTGSWKLTMFGYIPNIVRLFDFEG